MPHVVSFIGNTRASEIHLRQQIHPNHKSIFSQKVTAHSQKSQKFKQQTIQNWFWENKQLIKVQPLSCHITNCPNKVTELCCKPLDAYFQINCTCTWNALVSAIYSPHNLTADRFVNLKTIFHHVLCCETVIVFSWKKRKIITGINSDFSYALK